MKYLLLLVNAEGAVTTAPLSLRALREFPGGEGVSVHFRPVRNDHLFESAKAAGRLAYRILAGEGVVRAQLWVEYEVHGPHVNVSGRSSDLLFALALACAKWRAVPEHVTAIAATGLLDSDGATTSADGTTTVHSVQHTVAKVAAAVAALADEPAAHVFYPATDAGLVTEWQRSTLVPPTIRLHPVSSLEEALGHLGIKLERVYLGNPFRGLEPFEYRHRAIFFGRDREVRDVLALLLRREAAGAPGILVEGASGSGKSSFLRAGLLAALANPGSQPDDVRIAIEKRPFSTGLSACIWRAGRLPSGSGEQEIARSIGELWAALPELLSHGSPPDCCAFVDLVTWRRTAWPAGQRFIWLADQFEELLALGIPDTLIERFGQFLQALQADGVWTLASIRADAVPDMKRHDSLRAVFNAFEGPYYLPTLRGPALDDVIRRPAQAAGLTFDITPDGRPLDAVLRADVYGESDGLPQLQFTLNELYLKRSDRVLTFAAYRLIGGLAGSIACAASEAVPISEPATARTLRRVFRNLVEVDDSGKASRRYAHLSDITDSAQAALLSRLVDARLCVTDQLDGRAVASFAHEALLRTWPELIGWLQEESGLLQTRELAQRETRLWEGHQRSARWLAGADKLAAFEALVAADIDLSPPVRDFIADSRRRARRSTRIRQALFVVITLLAIFASTAGWFASRKQHEAEYQAHIRLEAQGRLLVDAATQRLKSGDVGGAGAIALSLLNDPQFQGLPVAGPVNVFQEIRAADTSRAVLAGHADQVETVAYAPDSAQLVTGSIDGTARIWDVRSGLQLKVLTGHGGAVLSATYSPDGSRIITASGDKTARIWDARTGAPLATLAGHSESVVGVAYSPSGRHVLTASEDKTVRVWDVGTGVPIVSLAHPDLLTAAAYSPDGHRIVTGSRDGLARVWDAGTGKLLLTLSGHTRDIAAVAFAPDGSSILTASFDKTAHLWDAQTGKTVAVLRGHTNALQTASYSADGRYIVTGSDDGTARIWDAATAALLTVVVGHQRGVLGAAFSPDGSTLATASRDLTVRVWDTPAARAKPFLAGHTDMISGLNYSPDGRLIVTASMDKTARVWDAHSGRQLRVLSGHSDMVHDAEFSPDGTRIVTASDDRSVRVWDTLTGNLTRVFQHEFPVIAAGFSPDGRRVVTATSANAVHLWDVATGQQVTSLVGHRDLVQAASYSPDGTRILSASFDGTARLWDAKTGTQLALLPHDTDVYSAAFSPDGRLVATGAGDALRLWDASAGKLIALLVGQRGHIDSVAFSPDGKWLVTAGADNTSRIWEIATGTQLAAIRGGNDGDYAGAAVYSPDSQRVLYATGGSSARLINVGVPPNLRTQIRWAAAAQFDELTTADRRELGISAHDAEAARFSSASKCDQAAGAFYDPDRSARGVPSAAIASDQAKPACADEVARPGHAARVDYEWGRLSLVVRDFAAARRHLELAASAGYRAARIDLARLLLDPTGGMQDPARAIALLERAWKEGVPIAAFELGRLYELGTPAANADAPPLLMSDAQQAWIWYQRGADAGEPTALARLAERAERDALAQGSTAPADADYLKAFRFYAAALRRADTEAWPDAACKQWRYRRATLARLLAREGMLQQVAGP